MRVHIDTIAWNMTDSSLHWDHMAVWRSVSNILLFRGVWCLSIGRHDWQPQPDMDYGNRKVEQVSTNTESNRNKKEKKSAEIVVARCWTSWKWMGSAAFFCSSVGFNDRFSNSSQLYNNGPVEELSVLFEATKILNKHTNQNLLLSVMPSGVYWTVLQLSAYDDSSDDITHYNSSCSLVILLN